MIRLCEGTLPPFAREDEAALRIAATVRDYGAAPFWRLYVGDGGSVFSVMGDRAALCAGDDAAEAVLFLSMDPSVAAVRTDAATARLLADCGFANVRTGTLLRCDALDEPAAREVREIPPREAWLLLCAVFGDTLPPFDAWYADVSHRVRHGGCRIAGAEEAGTLASVAMTVAESDRAVLIGGVATLPAARGRGLASACVAALCRMAQKEGKHCLLAPKKETLIPLYARLGFTPCGTWGEATRS